MLKVIAPKSHVKDQEKSACRSVIVPIHSMEPSVSWNRWARVRTRHSCCQMRLHVEQWTLVMLGTSSGKSSAQQ